MWTLIGGGEEGGMETIGIVSDIKRESTGHIDTSWILLLTFMFR